MRLDEILKMYEKSHDILLDNYNKVEILANKLMEAETLNGIEIKNILESSKEKMESFKLPIIPKDYYVELSEANDALDNMIDELNKKPISIRVLNLRVDTARDLVLKLHKNTSETIKNASLAESTIVYSNRFRYNNKINNALNRAEDYFYEGRYSEALELAIKAVSDVNPNIYNEVMIAKETIL